MSDLTPAKPGWYDDPKAPGSDRWWTGEGWSDLTARAPKSSLFGLEYERAMRTKQNPAAHTSRKLGFVALAGFLLAGVGATLVLAALLSDSPALGRVGVVISLTGAGVFLVFEVISMVFSCIALRRRVRLGAALPSVWSLFGATFGLFVAATLAIAATLAAAR